ncbi:hypothetical protein K503DRAFT_836207 [Rhizopogon vinicolor AM-OR11-026]|uniref:Uncharacterized protein n=1 Tax=Rhizopogon vinicolor AM-OR11-026 TaxID=1314800 RepID=A0A1B7MML2_9AGAM|nr:hypothetical protein K503DRAFT_836207 [Rhizopogon vinicolor AM-OR11-026]
MNTACSEAGRNHVGIGWRNQLLTDEEHLAMMGFWVWHLKPFSPLTTSRGRSVKRQQTVKRNDGLLGETTTRRLQAAYSCVLMIPAIRRIESNLALDQPSTLISPDSSDLTLRCTDGVSNLKLALFPRDTVKEVKSNEEGEHESGESNTPRTYSLLVHSGPDYMLTVTQAPHTSRNRVWNFGEFAIRFLETSPHPTITTTAAAAAVAHHTLPLLPLVGFNVFAFA